MILDLCSHAVTVSSKLFVVVCGDKSTEKMFWGVSAAAVCVRACVHCHRGLTVGAQGSCQHFNTLVSDGLPGGEMRGQQTPGGCGAGWGGGGFGGVGFGLPGKEKQEVFILLIILP